MTDQNHPLVERAREAALKAYAPYSGYSVGCAVESADGEVVVGANMENACYRLGVCAEVSALTAACQTFGLDRVKRIAVAGGRVENGGFPWVSRFGTLPAKLLTCRRTVRTAATGRYEMTFNLANAQQLLASLVGAVIASAIFVSAAVGPVSQFI